MISGSKPVPVGTAHGSVCSVWTGSKMHLVKRIYSDKGSKTVETDPDMQARVQAMIDAMQAEF